MQITYDIIKPLIVSEQLNGQQLNITFKSEDQDQPVQAVGMMIADQDQMMKTMKKEMIKQSAISIAISTVSRFIGSFFGGVGNMAASAAGSAMTPTMDGTKLMQVEDTPANRQKAALSAFESVKTFYEWDAVASKWKFKSFQPTA